MENALRDAGSQRLPSFRHKAKAGPEMALPLITSSLLEDVMKKSFQKVPIRWLQGDSYIPSGAFLYFSSSEFLVGKLQGFPLPRWEGRGEGVTLATSTLPSPIKGEGGSD